MTTSYSTFAFIIHEIAARHDHLTREPSSKTIKSAQAASGEIDFLSQIYSIVDNLSKHPFLLLVLSPISHPSPQNFFSQHPLSHHSANHHIL